MGLLHLLIAALAASAAISADPPCACVDEVQTIDPINKPMIFFQQPTLGGVMNGKTCSMNCTFVANLDAGASDDYALQIQLLTNQLGDGSMYIDGMSDTVSITSNTPTGLLAPKSYDSSITIHFSESDTNNGIFMVVVQKVQGRPPKPVTKAPVTVAPTAAFDPKFIHNPHLVANDIMLAFDLSSKDIDKYKTFAQKLIKELTINPKSLTSEGPEECGVGSRLSIVGLSGLSGFDYLYAPYWTTSYTQADGNIGSLVQIPSSTPGFYISPVGEKYINGFSNKGHNPEDIFTTCENRGKIFILLTSVAPAEYEKSASNGGESTPFIDFVNKGVHQIVVYNNMAGDDMKYYNHTRYDNADDGKGVNGSNIWNTFLLSGSDADIQNFFNSYLVDSKEPMTCQPTSISPNKVEVTIGNVDSTEPVVVNIPPYYNAKKTNGTATWETFRHYCNFQETTINLIPDASLSNRNTPVRMCIKVYYDLETGSDFVSIFSDDRQKPGSQKEVVRLTGRDISGTEFELPDAIGTIVFSSDEKNVYDGFHAEIKACP